MRLRFALVPLVPLALAACDRPKSGGASRFTCGLAATAAPQALINEFGVPKQTLSEPPSRLPERTVVRYAAGPATGAVVGRHDSLMVIGVEGNPPEGMKPGFGVLVVDRQDQARGVMVLQGLPVENAPQIGTLTIGDTTLPLIGVQTDPARIEDPRCALFPDSLAAR